MKVTVEIDCTPDEARQFMGLPDVKPFHAAMSAKMEEQAERLSPEALLRSWMAMVPQTPEQLKDVIGNFIRSIPGAPTTKA